MAFSIQRAVSDGTMTLLPISIEYFDREEISVLFNGVLNARQWAWVGTTERTLSFTPAVANTVEVMIVRSTDLAELRHQFSLGAQFTAESLDESLLQILHIAQEAREGSNLGEIFQNLDFHGFKAINMGNGSNPGDAVNHAQLQVHDATIVGYMNTTEGYKNAAATSAAAALVSASNAATTSDTKMAAHVALADPHTQYLRTTVLQDPAYGDNLVGYKNPNAGGAARSLHSKMTDFWVTPQDFGAVADGVTDDRAAIVAAITSGRPVYIPAGSYKVSSRITVPSNVCIRGDWRKTEIIFGTNADWLFEITGSNVVIEGLRLNFGALATGSGAFLMRTDLTTMERIYLRDIETLGASYLLYDQAHATNIIVMLHIQNVVARLHRGPGIALQRAFAYLILKFVTVDYVGSSSRNHIAYSLSGNQGSFWENVDVTNGLVDATTANAHGFAFANCIAVWMSNCMADTCGGHGFYFTTGSTYFYLNNCVASLCGRIGFSVVGGGNMHLTQCVASGRKGFGYAPVCEGFRIESGADKIQLTGTHAINNAGNGITLATTTRVTISGHRTDNSGGRGLDSAGTNSALITGSCFDLNPSGNVNLSSAGMVVASCQASSGALLAVTGPGSA